MDLFFSVSHHGFRSPALLSPFLPLDSSSSAISSSSSSQDYFSLSQDQLFPSSSRIFKDVLSLFQDPEPQEEIARPNKRFYDEMISKEEEEQEEAAEPLFAQKNEFFAECLLEEGSSPAFLPSTTGKHEELEFELESDFLDQFSPAADELGDFLDSLSATEPESLCSTSSSYDEDHVTFFEVPSSSSPAFSPASSPESSPPSSPHPASFSSSSSPAVIPTTTSSSSSTTSTRRPAKRARRTATVPGDAEEHERVIHRRRARKPKEPSPSSSSSCEEADLPAKPKKPTSKTGRTGGCKGDTGSPFASNFRLQVGPNQVSVLVLRHQGNNGAHPKNPGQFYFQARIRNVYPQRHLWAGWETPEGIESRIRRMLE